ncbi:MAG: cache domain-containing protein, partial [Chitinispirillales bacterium]|nr:cache domain-containing protein [Chitinispirillales bacterium]
MKIRTRILIYMVALTIISGFAVLVSSVLLYINHANIAMTTRNNTAQMVVEQELTHLKENARIAASRVAINNTLIDAVMSKNPDSIKSVSNNLKNMNNVDFCTILDNQGHVITRIHDSLRGDNLTHYPHIRNALTGNVESYIAEGMSMRFSVYAGAPVYDYNMNIIGVVSLGFMLNNQDFVHRLKTITGGEVSIFLGDERIASTIVNDDGTYVLGTRAAENISVKVLAGENYNGHIPLFGKDLFARYFPLRGAEDEIIGMQSVGFYTAGYTKKMIIFVVLGVMITLAVLTFCVIIARILSSTIERRIEDMMNEIRKADEYTNLMFNSIPMSCVLWGKNFNIVDCNQEALTLFKAKDKEELSSRFFELSDELQPNGENSRELTAKHTKRAFDQDSYYSFEWMHKTLEGEPLPVEVSLVRVQYKDDYLVAAYTRDLREHKAYLAEINKLHNIMEKLLKSMDTMIMVTDTESDKVIYLNEKFKNEFNFSDDAIGQQCWKLLIENATGRCGYCPKNDLDINSKNVGTREFYNPMTKGDYKITSRFIDWPDGSRVFMEQCVDISEVKILIDGITKAREAAETANKTKSTFLANMSHEIRTPMNSIIGFSELARDGDLPAKTREYLRNIHDSAEWLLKIINDILDISKIESGKIELEYIPFDLPDIFAHCQSVIMPKAREKGITL